MENPFGSWLESQVIRDHLTNPNIEAGEYSYYSGYYHGKPFEEHCVRYLLGDGSTRDTWESGIWGEVDRLIIGKFCSIGSGATFLLATNALPRNIAIALRLLQKGLELGNEDARFFKNMSQRLIDEHLEAEDAATGQLA